MGAPSTWSKKFAYWTGESDIKRGNSFRVGYTAPAGTDLNNVQAAFPRGSVFSGESGIFASILMRSRVDSDAEDGLDLVTLYYEPPSLRRVLESDPGRGYLEVDIQTDEVRAVKDLDGKYVWHEEYDEKAVVSGQTLKGALHRWRPVRGKGTILRNRMLFRLRVATDLGLMNTLADLSDNSTNDATLSNWANRPAGTMRLAGAHGERAMTTDALNYYDILAEYNKAGWNQDTDVQKYRYYVYEQQLRNADGTARTDEVEKVGGWKPLSALLRTNVKLYTPKSWLTLDRLIS